MGPCRPGRPPGRLCASGGTPERPCGGAGAGLLSTQLLDAAADECQMDRLTSLDADESLSSAVSAPSVGDDVLDRETIDTIEELHSAVVQAEAEQRFGLTRGRRPRPPVEAQAAEHAFLAVRGFATYNDFRLRIRRSTAGPGAARGPSRVARTTRRRRAPRGNDWRNPTPMVRRRTSRSGRAPLRSPRSKPRVVMLRAPSSNAASGHSSPRSRPTPTSSSAPRSTMWNGRRA